MRHVAILSRVFIAPIVALLLLPVSPWAGDTEHDRATLKGVEALWAVVGGLGPEAEQDGRTAAQFQRDVEVHPRQAGIALDSTSHHVLHVNVTAVRREIGVYAYAIEVAFLQPVRLLRDPRLVHNFAVTWIVGEVGMVGATVLSTVQSTVMDLVDQFINAYFDQNPRKVTRISPVVIPLRGQA